jgi:DDE superfamily endonuclease
MYLPPRTTCLIQPMDMKIILAIKQKCKWQLLRECIASDKGMFGYLKDINIKHAINWLVSAWDEVSTVTINQSWVNIGVVEQIDVIDDVADQTQILLNRLALRNHRRPFTLKETLDWLMSSCDDHRYYSDVEIVQFIKEKYNHQEETPARRQIQVFQQAKVLIIEDEQLELHQFVQSSEFSKALGFLDKSIELINSLPNASIQTISALGNARNQLMNDTINHENYCEENC